MPEDPVPQRLDHNFLIARAITFGALPQLGPERDLLVHLALLADGFRLDLRRDPVPASLATLERATGRNKATVIRWRLLAQEKGCLRIEHGHERVAARYWFPPDVLVLLNNKKQLSVSSAPVTGEPVAGTTRTGAPVTHDGSRVLQEPVAGATILPVLPDPGPNDDARAREAKTPENVREPDQDGELSTLLRQLHDHHIERNGTHGARVDDMSADFTECCRRAIEAHVPSASLVTEMDRIADECYRNTKRPLITLSGYVRSLKAYINAYGQPDQPVAQTPGWVLVRELLDLVDNNTNNPDTEGYAWRLKEAGLDHYVRTEPKTFKAIILRLCKRYPESEYDEIAKRFEHFLGGRPHEPPPVVGPAVSSKPEFSGMTIQEVWDAIQKRRAQST